MEGNIRRYHVATGFCHDLSVSQEIQPSTSAPAVQRGTVGCDIKLPASPSFRLLCSLFEASQDGIMYLVNGIVHNRCISEKVK